MIRNIMNLMNVPGQPQEVVKVVVIIAAVLLRVSDALGDKGPIRESSAWSRALVERLSPSSLSGRV